MHIVAGTGAAKACLSVLDRLILYSVMMPKNGSGETNAKPK